MSSWEEFNRSQERARQEQEAQRQRQEQLDRQRYWDNMQELKRREEERRRQEENHRSLQKQLRARNQLRVQKNQGQTNQLQKQDYGSSRKTSSSRPAGPISPVDNVIWLLTIGLGGWAGYTALVGGAGLVWTAIIVFLIAAVLRTGPVRVLVRFALAAIRWILRVVLWAVLIGLALLIASALIA